MAKSYWINAAAVEDNTVLQGSIDDNKLRPFIDEAQDIDIQNLLGTRLFDKIDTLIDDETIASVGIKQVMTVTLTRTSSSNLNSVDWTLKFTDVEGSENEDTDSTYEYTFDSIETISQSQVVSNMAAQINDNDDHFVSAAADGITLTVTWDAVGPISGTPITSTITAQPNIITGTTIATTTTGALGNEKYYNFLKDYIKPALQQAAAARFIEQGGYEVDNRGIYIPTSSKGTPASENERMMLADRVWRRYELYANKAYLFLCSGSHGLQEYYECKSGDICPSYEPYNYNFSSI